MRFFLDVVEESGGGSGVLYIGIGVVPIMGGVVVVSLRVVGLSPWVTDEGADADTEVDEAGREVSMDAGAMAAVEETSLAGAGIGVCRNEDGPRHI
ncbi:hypothetical protein ONZ43_g266 [Nemania bipapillata]|uniref:Uncharacterized protein n=1 Tax=Nemania bipapillata TaxID=110536 RepID=A0ACC2J8U6_9PEZI|nr:hypothetical protein ONZ43_g266 [Nemania bipapillata]